MNGKSVKVFFTAAFCLVFCACFSHMQAQVTWHTIQEADNARIGTKLYFVDFYTHWCGYCKKMDRDTFTDPTVAKILNRYYYPVKFNAESTEAITWKGKTFSASNGPRHPHAFARGLQGYPSFVLYNADGDLMQVIPGYYSPEDFTIILWYFASGDYNRYPFDRYQQIFQKEIKPQMEKKLK